MAGLAAGLAMLLLLVFVGARERIDDKVFDLFQRLRPRDLTDMRVAVVVIDSDSLRAIGPWPWSRYDLARLTERIGAAGATAIGYDMIFPEADRQAPAQFVDRYPELVGTVREQVLALPSFDDDFATVLGRFPTVLARVGVSDQSSDFQEGALVEAGPLPVEAIFSGKLPPTVATWRQALSSIPAIEEQSAGHGLVNGDPDGDGVVRRIPAVGSVAGTANTGFAVEVARVAAKQEAIGLRTAKGALTGVTLGARTIPVAPDGRYRLHFGHMPAGTVISAADLFRRGFDRRLVAGRAIVLGLTAAGTVDVVATPLEARYAGPFIQAQAVDAVERGGWLERPAWALAAELGMGVVLAMAAVRLVAQIRTTIATLIIAGAIVLILAAVWLAFAQMKLLIDPLTPLLIGGSAAGGAFFALYLETRLVQQRLRTALIGERLSAERAAGELEAARKIQKGMLPPRAQLAALDPRVDLDARLEPAREIGGDLYDAFTLPDGRMLFLVGDVTGKGVPAALFMALSKALARSAIDQHRDDLGAAVARLSAELSRDNAEDMFVTLLLGGLDPATGNLALVNAGHENPFIRRADGAVEELAMSGGPPVCVADGFPYEVELFTLSPGDGLLIVTDGVTEAQDRAGDFFDRAGAAAAIATLPQDWRAEQATAVLTEVVRAFENGSPPTDDLTVMALRWLADPISER